MDIPETSNQLIHAIYRGVGEDVPWTDFLSQLHDYFNCDSAAILLAQPEGPPGDKYLLNRVVQHSDEMRPNSSHWIYLDPFQTIPTNKPVLLDELDFQGNIEDTAFFKELILPAGKRYIAALNITEPGTPNLVMKLRLARAAHRSDFGAAEKSQLLALLPHLQLAMHFFDQLAVKTVERDAYVDAVNHFMIGTLVVDRNGRIVGSNRVARESLARYPVFVQRDGALGFNSKTIERRFYAALANIDNGRSTTGQLPTTLQLTVDDGAVLGVMIRAINRDDDFSHPVHSHAVVFISDPASKPGISADTLQELFDFTAKEAGVAACLANGMTLNEAAEALSVSVNTAKSHAQHIYEKTGVNKQIKFIQLVSRSLARVS